MLNKNKRQSLKSFQLTTILIIILQIFFGCNDGSTDTDAIDKKIKTGTEKILSNIHKPKIPDRSINLVEFSGKEPDQDGTFNFRPAIQKAIDNLSNRGGGKIIFPHPQGREAWIKQTVTYKSEGPINLKNNIELVFDPNTRLYFEFGPQNYLYDGKGVLTRYEGTTLYSFSPCLRAFNVKNIAITAREGSGAMPIIDGDGEAWQRWKKKGDDRLLSQGKMGSWKLPRKANNADVPIRERWFDDPAKHFLRPCLVEFFLCENILMDGIKLEDSPFWVIHPIFSQNMIFRNLAFDCPVVNNDGIDPESSKNVLIENIIFDNHDDNVAIKAGRDKEGRQGAIVKGTELENIKSEYINDGRIGGPAENIIVRDCVFKGHYGFCIGSEMSGSVRNVYCLDNIAPQNASGVFLKSSRMRGGIIEDIYVKGLELSDARFVVALIPNYDADTSSPHVPVFRDIYIDDIQAENTDNGIEIHGWYDQPIQNVMLKDIKINKVENEPFLIQQVQNVELENVTIENKSYDGIYNKRDKKSKPKQKI